MFKVFGLYKEFIKFLFTGVINTVITLVVIFLMYYIFNIHYIISNVIGYVLGFINSFFMNKFWTFRSKGKILRELIMFFKIFFICYLVQLGFLYYFSEKLHIKKDLSQIFSMIIYTIANFILNKYLTFR